MLILSRKPGESILIGEDVELIVLEAESNQIKIGIRAPKHVKVMRKEIVQTANAINKEASKPSISFDELKNSQK